MKKPTNVKKTQSRFVTARLLVLCGVLLTLALFLFGSTVGGQFGVVQQMIMQSLGPIQGGASKLTNSFQAFAGDYLALWNIRDDNKQLRLKIVDYQQQLDQLREAYARNRYLENELAFKKVENFPALTARVVGKDPSFWFKTLIVDRGKNDGVIKGMVARTSLGVVGQVIQVSDNYAKILLTNAPSSAVDAMIQKNRVRGILKGAADKGYVLYYVLKNAEVEVGDRVVTAGVGGVFPSGIPLGTVSEVRSKRRGMFQEIEVAPVVDFGRLEMVFIDLSERQKIAEEMGITVPPAVD
ncbi:MAG: rod shape-determining protein MreC [Desulfobulbaceae bacterium]|nr:rod shape-determining protein MreC [Desulfobulbaceae bacterium]